MLRTPIRIVAGVTTVAVGLKIIQTTGNEDWPLVKYQAIKACRRFILPKDKEIKGGDGRKKIVVLGSGWGALSFIQQLDAEQFDVTIVSPRSYFFYTPLLAGTATGTVSPTSILEPIRWYCSNGVGGQNIKYIQAECSKADLKEKKLTCKLLNTIDESSSKMDFQLDYDCLIVAVGAEPATFGIPGVKEHATFMKEVEDGIRVKRQILHRLETASSIVSSATGTVTGAKAQLTKEQEEAVDKLLHWVVVGGGPTGVELTAELNDFIKQDVLKYFPDLIDRVKVTLVEATGRILGMFDEQMADYAENALTKRGATVLCNAMVTKITPEYVELKVKAKEDGPLMIKYGTLVWAGGIAVRPITRAIASQVEGQSSRWGLEVDGFLRVKGVDDNSLWAIGDCAVAGCAPTAQAANQQGKYLGRLFRESELVPERLSSSSPFVYVNKGALAYVGASKGVAELKNLWDVYPSEKGQMKVEGMAAFTIWRSLYFSKLMSGRNQAQVAFDWAKSSVFGRDIASPEQSEPEKLILQPKK